MSSSFIGDAKYQELNMSFTFDEKFQDKLIVNAVVDHNPYQLELLFNPDLDFDDIKNALLAKQFKLLSKSPEVLKLKIAFASFEFKNVEKMALNTLKETITDLSNKLKDKSQRILVLEDVVKQLRNDFDSMTTQVADLRRTNDENKQEIIQVTKETIDLRQKSVEQSTHNNELTAKIDQYENELDSIRKQLHEENIKNQSQDQTISVLETKLEKQEEAIQQLKKKEDELLLKWRKDVDDQRLKQTQKKTEIERQIQIISPRLEQMEMVQFTQNCLQLIEEIKQMPIVKQKSLYSFSPQRKTNLITLSNNNSKATHPNQSCGMMCLALVEGAVFRKGSSIRFKMQTIGKIVGVGLTLRNVVAANSYALKNYKEIGHGCFLLYRYGSSYSHSNKEQNHVQTEFKYGVGDVIGVKTNEDDLLFVNETKKREHRLKLSLTEEEWKQACFCVRLDSQNDSVSIV